MQGFLLAPAKSPEICPHGRERAMVEVFLLMAFHHGAARLEYRTIENEFRVAEIIGDKAYEFPQPPESVRQPTVNYLKEISGVTSETGGGECCLRVGVSTARVRMDFVRGQDAIVTVLNQFDPPVNLYRALRRFWKMNAAKKGLIGLTKFYFQDVWWYIRDWRT